MPKKLLTLGAKLSAFSLLSAPLLLAVLTVLVQIVLQFFLFGENLATGKGPGPSEDFACFIVGSGWTNCDFAGLLKNLVFSFFFTFPVFFLALVRSGTMLLMGLGGLIGVILLGLLIQSKFLPNKKTVERKFNILFVLIGALAFLAGIFLPFRNSILDILTI